MTETLQQQATDNDGLPVFHRGWEITVVKEKQVKAGDGTLHWTWMVRCHPPLFWSGKPVPRACRVLSRAAGLAVGRVNIDRTLRAWS